MAVCPNCGQESPDGFRFCGACGAALAVAAPSGGEERRLVTVLFCDLVGFTARSDQADPEDVGAMLRPYHMRLRAQIERFGGTLDKFIGDAVMAVFGSPVAHEDDPERALRCALSILGAIAEMNAEHPTRELAVRIGINSGEALVNLGPGEETEGVVGDVVNTASRLQGVAPVAGVVVGEATWRATRALFEFEELEPVRVKGKAQPVPLWRLLGARSRLGVDARPRSVTPFVGRDGDLGRLEACFEAVVDGRVVRLATVVGEPGVGKSRLVHELGSMIDARPELVAWRQGRCIPYGDGVTFWALGEIVKAQAGILESDARDEVVGKLDATVKAIVDDPADREWLKGRLAPLVGLIDDDAPATDRTESFTAWRRFIESVAATRPLVLVVEDVHWADPALLEFIEHLVEAATGVPLLVVVTARPELRERRPDWGDGSITIALSPLSDEQTAALVAALLGQPILPVEVQALLLERAGGNPLYAEEFVRLLTDRGLLERQGRTLRLAAGTDVLLPDTLQALIAARLDLLPADARALLQDAAVLGRVFWSGGLAAMSGRDEATVRDALGKLVARQLLRVSPASSVEHQAEYVFWHALVRDVAYAQIPRAARVKRHRSAATWLEGLAGERVADHAELIAHHYMQALTLARAAGEPTAGLVESARRFAVLAGDRAMNLDVATARAYYGQALELLAADAPERARVLVSAGRVAFQAGDVPEAVRLYEAGIAAHGARGDRVAQGAAMERLCTVLWHQGETRRAREVLTEAVALLEAERPSAELCSVYAQMAADLVLSGHDEEALGWADKALAVSDQLDDVAQQRLRALDARGMARCDLGDLGGIEDLRAALGIGLELGAGFDTTVVYNNLAEPVWLDQGAAAALELCRQGLDFAERRGIVLGARWLRLSSLGPLFDLGSWDEVLATTAEMAEWARGQGARYTVVWAERATAQVLVRRGELRAARTLVDGLLPAAREIDDLQLLVPALVVAAQLEQAGGGQKAALALVEELIGVTRDRSGGHWYWGQQLADMARIVVAAGADGLLEDVMGRVGTGVARHRHSLLTARTVLAEARGDLEAAAGGYDQAAAAWAGYGYVLERGLAELGAGRCLLALGQAAADARLRAASATFAGLGAQPLMAEADGLLARASERAG